MKTEVFDISKVDLSTVREVMRYEIITADTPEVLSQKVNVRLKASGQTELHGGPFLFGNTLCQAVTN